MAHFLDFFGVHNSAHPTIDFVGLVLVLLLVAIGIPLIAYSFYLDREDAKMNANLKPADTDRTTYILVRGEWVEISKPRNYVSGAESMASQ